jgi:hypothetical protein
LKRFSLCFAKLRKSNIDQQPLRNKYYFTQELVYNKESKQVNAEKKNKIRKSIRNVNQKTKSKVRQKPFIIKKNMCREKRAKQRFQK